MSSTTTMKAVHYEKPFEVIVKEVPLPKMRVHLRPTASRGVAAKVTEAWGKADSK